MAELIIVTFGRVCSHIQNEHFPTFRSIFVIWIRYYFAQYSTTVSTAFVILFVLCIL